MILVLIGAALGLAFGLVKAGNYGKNLDMDELHLAQIEQYARYVQMYEEQEAYEAESVYLNLERTRCIRVVCVTTCACRRLTASSWDSATMRSCGITP